MVALVEVVAQDDSDIQRGVSGKSKTRDRTIRILESCLTPARGEIRAAVVHVTLAAIPGVIVTIGPAVGTVENALTSIITRGRTECRINVLSGTKRLAVERSRVALSH